MNILFVLPEYYPHSGGGISTYYLHYIQALIKYGLSVKVIVGSGYTQDEKTYALDGIEIEYLKPSIFETYLKKFSKLALFPEYQKNLAAAWAIWDQVKGGKGYDIIECTDFGLGYIPWIINHNKPVVTRLHGSFGQIELKQPELKQFLNGDLNRSAELNLLPQSDILITHSKSNQAFWEKMFNTEVKMIYPVFIPPEKVNLADEKSDFAIVCARVQQWKGPDVLCKAVQQLDNTCTEIRWYGKDTEFNSTSSKSEHLKKEFPDIWGNKIIWHPALPNNKILDEQRKAKFAIIPSTWDMFNFTCLEYLSAGVPVICSEGTGVSELIENGVNGFKYPGQDHNILANFIRFLNVMAPTEQTKMKDAGKRTLNTLLAPENIIPQNITLYNKTIQNFEVKLPNKYIHAIYEPSETIFKIEDTLNVQPLRLLLKYILTRIKKKLIKIN